MGAGKPGDGPSFGTIRDIGRTAGLEDRTFGRWRGFRRLLVRIYESNVLWTAAGKYRYECLVQLAGEPMGDSAQGFVHEFGYVQLGAYEVNPNYLLARNALNLGEPGGASGVLVPFEVGWLPTFGDRLNRQL